MSRTSARLERQAKVRELRSGGMSKSDIATTLNIDPATVRKDLEFFDETDTECGYDPEPHYAPDHRACRLRKT